MSSRLMLAAMAQEPPAPSVTDEDGDEFVSVPDVCGPSWWAMVHGWAESVRDAGCSTCGEHAVQFVSAMHDLVNIKLMGEGDRSKSVHDRISELGKYVFGQSFDVELNDQLEVVTRTLNGITLPYVNLSTGAREQIGLLMRLAAAMLADNSGGVPLVLDDTLGSTDRSRLEGAGVAISVAARSCQIILLTSMPERYQHIDTAKSVRLF